MTMLNTPAQIEGFVIMRLKVCLSLETKGLMVSQDPSAYAQVKAMFGFKGSKAKVLAQLEAWIEENPIACRVTQTEQTK